ncbi:hypothetical protein KBW81_12865 [Loktanella salsilacus]|uniref:hypothetical protein n=1 Tax=Loktanella salsilacus TaxID=195913 RepID=UPI0020B7E2A2|nr:hypothetical protein [Loktanella salsilacus]UTH47597.1 hypothetical protein KBW81_12865 [Loktanella salsilacus]
MTTYSTLDITCALCSQVTPQNVILSTNSYGWPDLDLRPAEMERSTLEFWVQRCSKCGYVSKDIEIKTLNAELALGSDRLKRVAFDSTGNDIQDRCLEAVIFYEYAEDFRNASDCALYAAWMADDQKKTKSAELYRAKAADLLIKYFDRSNDSYSGNTLSAVRLVDVLRRGGRWSECQKIANELCEFDLEKKIRAVVGFGIWAAYNCDSGCYTVEDALAFEKFPRKHGSWYDDVLVLSYTKGPVFDTYDDLTYWREENRRSHTIRKGAQGYQVYFSDGAVTANSNNAYRVKGDWIFE